MDTSIFKASFFICLCRVSSAQYMPQMPMGQMPQTGQMMPSMGQMMPGMPPMGMGMGGMPPMGMGMGGMPPMMPGAMPLPIPMAMPQPKLPVVVMPFHSKHADKKRKDKKEKKRKKKKKKKRRPKKDESGSSDESTEESCSSEFDFDTNDSKYGNIKRSGRGKHRREVLTPVISYVNQKGDVVYQKKIKNDKAKDWLDKAPRKQQALTESSDERKNGREMSYKEFKDIYKRKRGRRERYD